MLSLEIVIAGAIMVSLTFYVLMAGADYGGGVWDLFAFGNRARAQRELIANAIGPIWEANHVWLIIVVVVLFTAFPAAFSILSISLHIPITLALIGIVLRGSAFTFRTYDVHDDPVQLRWGRIFAIASSVTPILLGAVIGAVSSGRVRPLAHDFITVYVNSWWAPFPIAVGVLALVLFAYLAAVYLTLETDDIPLQEDFRHRALVAGLVAPVVAASVFLLSEHGAPLIWEALTTSTYTWPLQLSTGVAACVALLALWFRNYRLARLGVTTQVALILWGWGFAQFPYLIQPDITIWDAAAPAMTLRLLLIALALGGLILFPSIYYLLFVFKNRELPVVSFTEHSE